MDGESMTLSEAKSKVLQFLMTCCTINLEKSLAAAPEQVVSIYVLAGDLEVASHWHLADFMRGLYFGSKAHIRGDCECLREARPVVSECFPSLVADSLSLATHCIEVMSRASILEGRTGD